MKIVLLALLCCGSAAAGASDWLRIHSPELRYDLQYKAIQTTGYQPGDPVLYVVDGAWYENEGQLPALVSQLVGQHQIRPLLLVLVDARDPDDLRQNRRHQQFMCNQDYVAFYRQTLIPLIDKQYRPASDPAQRVMLGLSFGAVNTACFGLLLPEQFGGLAMQSPGNSQHLAILTKLYQQQPKLPLRLFLSFGTQNDNLAAGRKFRQVLQQKGYPLAYREVRAGHNWRNWQPLLDDILRHFFGADTADATAVRPQTN